MENFWLVAAFVAFILAGAIDPLGFGDGAW